MALLTHIIIAVLSLFYSLYLFLSPSRLKLRVSYGLMALTTASGTYLIVTSNGHMLETCTVGLLYLGLTTFGILSARHRLAADISQQR